MKLLCFFLCLFSSVAFAALTQTEGYPLCRYSLAEDLSIAGAYIADSGTYSCPANFFVDTITFREVRTFHYGDGSDTTYYIDIPCRFLPGKTVRVGSYDCVSSLDTAKPIPIYVPIENPRVVTQLTCQNPEGDIAFGGAKFNDIICMPVN